MNGQNAEHIPPQYPPSVYPRPQNPLRVQIRRNANIVCFGLGLVILLGIFLSPVLDAVSDLVIGVAGVESREAVSAIDTFSDLIVYILMFLIPTVIMVLWIGIPLRVAFPLRKPRGEIVLPAVFCGLGMSVVGMLTYSTLTVLLQNLFGVAPYLPEMSMPVGAFASVVYFLRMTAVPAILEEVMFRGVIMQSLRRFGDMFALVCSSILFALAHHNLVQGPNALLVGLVIGFFVLRLGSLKVGILMHFVNNALAVTTELATRNLDGPQSSVVTLLVLSFYAASGIIAFAYLMYTHNGMFRLAPSAYQISGGGKYGAFFLTPMPLVYIAGVIVITCFQFR